MGKFVVLGAALAAAMQTLVPQNVFTGLTTPFVGALIMSSSRSCSRCARRPTRSSRSRSSSFRSGPQLAFLAAGPVLDTKLSLLYGGTSAGLRGGLASSPSPSSSAGSMLVQGSSHELDWPRLTRRSRCGVGRLLRLPRAERRKATTWDRGPRGWSRSAASCSASRRCCTCAAPGAAALTRDPSRSPTCWACSRFWRRSSSSRRPRPPRSAPSPSTASGRAATSAPPSAGSTAPRISRSTTSPSPTLQRTTRPSATSATA